MENHESSTVNGLYLNLTRQLIDILKFTDNAGEIGPLTSGSIDNGVEYPSFMTFEKLVDVSTIGHQFVSLDITVTDQFGNEFTRSIQGPTLQVTFNDNDGNLRLGASNVNGAYSVIANLITDLCIEGSLFHYELYYIHNSCAILNNIGAFSNYADNSSNIYAAVQSLTIPSSNPGGSMTFGEISSGFLPQGHNFSHLDITVEDDRIGRFTKSINTANTMVTFNHGEGNLVLDNSDPGRLYRITLILFTTACSNGQNQVYQIKYS